VKDLIDFQEDKNINDNVTQTNDDPKKITNRTICQGLLKMQEDSLSGAQLWK